MLISTSKLTKTEVSANQNMTLHTFSETILVLNDQVSCIRSYSIIHVGKTTGRRCKRFNCNAATQSEANLAWLSSGAASGLRPLLVNRPERGSSHGLVQEKRCARHGILVSFPSTELHLFTKIKALASASQIYKY